MLLYIIQYFKRFLKKRALENLKFETHIYYKYTALSF